MARYTVAGSTDERDSCDCCGKTGLKKTVVLSDADTGEFVFFGTTCAAKATGWMSKDIRKAARTADAERRSQEQLERSRRASAELARWTEYLVGQTGGLYTTMGDPDILGMVQALGGYGAARAGYRAA